MCVRVRAHVKGIASSKSIIFGVMLPNMFHTSEINYKITIKKFDDIRKIHMVG